MKSEKEKPVEPLIPWVTLSATSGKVTVVAKLYGEPSEERRVREQKLIQRRAEQLDT